MLLDGLPVDLRRQGLAEAYKAGQVGDPSLASLIGRDGIEARTDEVVRRSLAVKKDLVDRDPRDVGDRMHLNLGHTIGHAVEYSSASSHGESVSLGLVAAARISQALAGFDDSETVIDALRGLDLPISITGLDRDEVRALVGKDKKRDSAGVRMVLLREIGQPFVTHVDDHAIDIGLAAVGI
jgi:3-dehydroquinate synthase